MGNTSTLIARLNGPADHIRPLSAGGRIGAVHTDADGVGHSRLQRVDALPLPAAEGEVYRPACVDKKHRPLPNGNSMM
jgi:hypothetical protein